MRNDVIQLQNQRYEEKSFLSVVYCTKSSEYQIPDILEEKRLVNVISN